MNISKLIKLQDNTSLDALVYGPHLAKKKHMRTVWLKNISKCVVFFVRWFLFTSFGNKSALRIDVFQWENKYLRSIVRKSTFKQYAENEVPDQAAHNPRNRI